MASGTNSEDIDQDARNYVYVNRTSNNTINVHVQGDLHVHNHGRTTTNSNTQPSNTLTGQWSTSYAIPLDTLQFELQDNRRQGYRLTNLVGYRHNGRERYQTLWVRGTTPEWSALYGLSKEEYETAVEDFKSRGFHPTKVCGYVVRRQIKFAAIWEEKPITNLITKVNMTDVRFYEAYDNFKRVGYMLVHFNTYSVNNLVHYAAIWEQRADRLNELELVRNYTQHDLSTKCARLFRNGYQINVICGYSISGWLAFYDYYAALFERRIQSRSMSVNWGYSYDQYKHEIDNIIAQNFTPTQVHAFALGYDSKYCIMWDK